MLMSNGALVATSTLADIASPYGEHYYYPRTGLELSEAFASYAHVYRSQVWISALVNKIAYGTARLPLKVYERAADDSRAERRDHPMAKLLRAPNSRHDPFFFWLWTVSTHEVYGEALWAKIRPAPGRPPTQLWPMHPTNVYTVRKEDGTLVYRYVYAGGDKALEFGVEDVVHFKSYNPEDQVRGMSRLEPLRQTILNEDASRRAGAAMWKHGGRPSMVVTHPKTLTDGAHDRLRESVRAIYGGVDNWGKIAVLEEGVTPTLMPLNAEEMQYIEARKVSREEACGMYDVPPPVVHILDRATFSNITEQMRSMYRDTMAPRLGLFESVLDFQLRPDFDPGGRFYAEFLLDEVMRGAFEQRAAANQSAIFSGQRTPNEVRKQDNLPPMEGGDQLYINAGAVPLTDWEQSAQTQKTTVGQFASESRMELEQVIDVDQLCAECGKTEQLSVRDLCSACEGRRGRMLALGEAGS